jgi:hypothetical protein
MPPVKGLQLVDSLRSAIPSALETENYSAHDLHQPQGLLWRPRIGLGSPSGGLKYLPRQLNQKAHQRPPQRRVVFARRFVGR